MATAAVHAAERPNIVLIFADDQGWQDAGYLGSDFHETPHVDRLTGQGMAFRHAYSAMGNCAPRVRRVNEGVRRIFGGNIQR